GEDDAPGVRRNRAAGDAEQRGLAGAVRPDDAERLALGEREIERARDDHGAEALGDFFEGEDGRHARVVRISCSTLSCKHLSTAHSRAWRVEDARKRAYGGETEDPQRKPWSPPPGRPPPARRRGRPP